MTARAKRGSVTRCETRAWLVRNSMRNSSFRLGLICVAAAPQCALLLILGDGGPQRVRLPSYSERSPGEAGPRAEHASKPTQGSRRRSQFDAPAEGRRADRAPLPRCWEKTRSISSDTPRVFVSRARSGSGGGVSSFLLISSPRRGFPWSLHPEPVGILACNTQDGIR